MYTTSGQWHPRPVWLTVGATSVALSAPAPRIVQSIRTFSLARPLPKSGPDGCLNPFSKVVPQLERRNAGLLVN